MKSHWYNEVNLQYFLNKMFYFLLKFSEFWCYGFLQVFLQVLYSGFLKREGRSKLLEPKHAKFDSKVSEKLGLKSDPSEA